MDVEECLEKGYLAREEPKQDLIYKELSEAKYDMEKAEKALREKDYKWAIVKSYYAMFHAGKAVCFKIGFREKRHFAVLVVLEHSSKQGKLEGKFVDDFKAGMSAREGADYRYIYSRERAEQLIAIAKEFLARMRKFI